MMIMMMMIRVQLRNTNDFKIKLPPLFCFIELKGL